MQIKSKYIKNIVALKVEKNDPDGLKGNKIVKLAL